MGIIENIVRQYQRLRCDNIMPERIYIGRETFSRFKNEIKPWEIYQVPSEKRPEYNGMQIYVVDSDEHLKVV